jgi:predicted hotdog family 3-hydroxylacyl-ACP dehydratase
MGREHTHQPLSYISSYSDAHLRCNIIWSPTEGASKFSIKDFLFAHAKICQFAVAMSVQENIVQFQVPLKQNDKKINGKIALGVTIK